MYPGPSNTIDFDGDQSARLVKWKIKTLDAPLSRGSILFIYKLADKELRFKCNTYGKVSKFLVQEGEEIHPGTALMEYIPCSHPCVIKDLCADCGQDLRELGKSVIFLFPLHSLITLPMIAGFLLLVGFFFLSFHHDLLSS